MESKSLALARSFLHKTVDVCMDRPMGTEHPKHGFIYEVNYGYIEGTTAPDGEALDAYYLGVNVPLQKATGIVIALIHRKNNDDDKLIVVPEGIILPDNEISALVHFQEKWFESVILRN